ncbi:MAG: PadR family transcriptional regulator [bacterium]
MRQPALRKLDLQILSLLSEKPGHGYALLHRHHLTDSEVTSSQMYYVLRKLEGLGLTQVKCEASYKAPDKSVHLLSAKGRRFLERDVVMRIKTLRQKSVQLFELYKENQEQLAASDRLMRHHASGILSRRLSR